ncbi:MAG: hypothetical protein R2851_03800 [Caldilineaceae bacterium]
MRKPGKADLDGVDPARRREHDHGLDRRALGTGGALRAWVQAGRPIWERAGMILLAAYTGQKQGGQPLLGGLDVTVNRNYFGRQVDSFETLLSARVG